jgi:uncharacterized protein (DUF885 family)
VRIFVSLVIAIFSFQPALAQSADDTLYKFFEAEWAYQMEQSPESATRTGYPGYNDRWTDSSLDAIESRKAHTRQALSTLESIEPASLSIRARLDHGLYLRRLQLSVAGQQFPGELMPMTQLRGAQQDLAMTISVMPKSSVSDFENIIKRLRTGGEVVDQEVALLKEGLKRGLTPPKITLRDIPDQVRNQIVDDPFDSPLLRVFENMPASISEDDQKRFREEAAAAYRDQITPAYERMLKFLEDDYLPDARDSIAATSLPNGEAWYAHNIRLMTTTDLSAEAIHELGQSEVKRIREAMEAVIVDAQFDGTFKEFTEFLRTDPQFYFTEAHDLMITYRDIAKRVDAELPRIFATLPRLPYGVDRIPSFAEKSQTTAYYQPGSPKAGRPGIFYANTYNLATRPKWEMEALTLHEAMPGHHLQIAIAQELEEVPEFRRWSGPTAFVEGWGLYAESLGEEMGFYADPYNKFGQLTYEMWRAVRLVVDTGMHALGWSRQEAIDFFMANTGKSEHDITVEIDRYIVWPGQALAYKLGELKFKELRARAEEKLGDNFDIRTFHDALLEEGALPLDLLEERIDKWIDMQATE